MKSIGSPLRLCVPAVKPRADYIIVPAAGSLVGHIRHWLMTGTRANAVAQRTTDA
jgi:hypothetical protein